MKDLLGISFLFFFVAGISCHPIHDEFLDVRVKRQVDPNQSQGGAGQGQSPQFPQSPMIPPNTPQGVGLPGSSLGSFDPNNVGQGTQNPTGQFFQDVGKQWKQFTNNVKDRFNNSLKDQLDKIRQRFSQGNANNRNGVPTISPPSMDGNGIQQPGNGPPPFLPGNFNGQPPQLPPGGFNGQPPQLPPGGFNGQPPQLPPGGFNGPPPPFPGGSPPPGFVPGPPPNGISGGFSSDMTTTPSPTTG